MIGIRDSISLLFFLYMLSNSILKKEFNYSGLIIFGFSLGFLRRFLPYDSILSISSFHIDPLLLVIPSCYLICFTFFQKSDVQPKILSASLKILILISTLEIFNPRQGSLVVGISGWIAYVIPILFVYAGTQINEKELNKILNTVKYLGVGVCVYGFTQVVFGYNSWDYKWFQSVSRSGEYSIFLNGSSRPFATFSSIGEYAQAIGIASGIVSYQYLQSKIRFYSFFLYTLIFVSSASLTASRGALIFTIFIAIFPWVLKSRPSSISKMLLLRIIPSLLGSIVLIPVTFSYFFSKLDDKFSILLNRQAAGISGNNSGVTPATVHLTQTFQAFTESFKSVYGYGVGAISGSQRLNGSLRINFESDIGNSSYAFGIFGFLVMLAIFYGIYDSLNKLKFDDLLLLILVLFPSINNWFNPGHYSTVWLVWVIVGAILRKRLKKEINA